MSKPSSVFDTLNRSYTQVIIQQNEIDIVSFLEATESLIKILGE